MLGVEVGCPVCVCVEGGCPICVGRMCMFFHANHEYGGEVAPRRRSRREMVGGWAVTFLLCEGKVEPIQSFNHLPRQ